MSHNTEFKEPLYKLLVRFSNGELIHFITLNPIDAKAINPETRYAIVKTYQRQDPEEPSDVSVINLRDVTYIKTERITLEQLNTEHRMAGMRAGFRPPETDRAFSEIIFA